MFPNLYAPLFVYSGCLSSEDVQTALYVCDDSEMDEAAMAHLRRYIQECDETGMFIVLWYVSIIQDMTSYKLHAF